MKNLIKDNSGIMNPIVICILSLAVVCILYFMFMPLLWFISNQLIAIGAPAATTLWYMKMAQWGFILFAAAALIVLIIKVYNKIHDTTSPFEEKTIYTNRCIIKPLKIIEENKEDKCLSCKYKYEQI